MEHFSGWLARANTSSAPLRDQTNTNTLFLSWLTDLYRNVDLCGVGLVALTDISTVARRTAMTGTSALSDALVLCPGLHNQQSAPELNDEYPACAAMTTSYVFRIENQATVLYLQKVGRTGHLTTVSVSEADAGTHTWLGSVLPDFTGSALSVVVGYWSSVLVTTVAMLIMILVNDSWGLAVLAILVLIRLTNVLIIRRRARIAWKGEREPGQQSDLIILLSQDRWVRVRGAVDDVKAITSGAWLQDPTIVENSLVTFAKLLAYLDAALAMNMSKSGHIFLLLLLFGSACLLGLVNEGEEVFRMYGRRVKVEGARTPYPRRLHLAKQLVKEMGTSDWTIALGMAKPIDIEAWKKEEKSGSGSSTRSRNRSEERDKRTSQTIKQVIL